MKHEHIIKSVEEGSIAWEMGIEPGDRLLQINGSIIEDVFDYHYYTNDEELLILIQKENGEEPFHTAPRFFLILLRKHRNYSQGQRRTQVSAVTEWRS